MTDQEANIKMAEMCGYNHYGPNKLMVWRPDPETPKYTQERPRHWNPAKNIEQAFEVLEALPVLYDVCKESGGKIYPRFYAVSIYNYESDFICQGLENERRYPEAIFQAVKKYLEAEYE